jgi:serine/threonine-protein kinase
MGEVYRARDPRLGRDVAVKVLPTELASDARRLRRFEQEARAASALNHPNIVTIHEIDEHEDIRYIVMEYVEGVTLRELLTQRRLTRAELVGHATQIAAGLARAHAASIVHRDLKPENLMVTSDGLVKILDFGLAKLEPSSSDVGSEDATVSRETREGAIIGTVLYMSPEQAAGRPVDHRSDQFSFGTILYEMATGTLPFKRDTAPQTQAAIIEDEAEPLASVNTGVPASVARVVDRCLSKDPGRRYDSTADLAQDLHDAAEASTNRPDRRKVLLAGAGVLAVLIAAAAGFEFGALRDRVFGGSGSEPIRSLAVLPLKNLSGDEGQEYFSDGMTEALIADLAQVEALKVISSPSMMTYKGTGKTVPQIAEELEVDAVVAGSVLRAGDRVRVTAQLITAETDEHLWSASYERELRDILELQSEVARVIVEEIQAVVTPAEAARLSRARPVDPAAHEAYLLGRYHLNRVTPRDLTQAIDHFEHAIERDPGFAPPYAYLAHTIHLAGSAIGPLIPPREAWRRSKDLAQQATAIDPELAEGHSALGGVVSTFEWDWSTAEIEFRRAIALNPGSPQVRLTFAVSLTQTGRHEEALDQMEQAIDLDPLNLRFKTVKGLLLYCAGHSDDAVQQLQTVLSLNPRFPQAHRFLGLTYSEKGMHEEAIAELRQAAELTGGSPNDLAYLGGALAAAGRADEARSILRGLEERAQRGELVGAWTRYNIHLHLGEADEALSWLEKAIDGREGIVSWDKYFPGSEPLRDDPRYQALLRRLNLAG